MRSKSSGDPKPQELNRPIREVFALIRESWGWPHFGEPRVHEGSPLDLLPIGAGFTHLNFLSAELDRVGDDARGSRLLTGHRTKPRKFGLSCSLIHSACTKLSASGCDAREAQSRYSHSANIECASSAKLVSGQ